MRVLAGKLPVFFFFLLLFVLPAATRADEIVITSGYLTRPAPGNSGPTFSFGNPAQGFNVSNEGYTQGDGGGGYAICSPCTSGQSITINGLFIGGSTLGYGAATINGVSYERVYYQSGNLSFSSPTFTVPLDNSPLFSIEIPFTMTGSLDLWLDPNQPPAFFTTTLSGQGTATVVFSSYFTQSHGWLHDFRGITYNFAPAASAVPEPATVILLGTGLGALATRYRRRRRDGSHKS